MAAIGIALLWGGYWLTLSGVSLVKGWNNSPLGLANPVKLATFTKQCYVGSGIIPTGDPADSGSCLPNAGAISGALAGIPGAAAAASHLAPGTGGRGRSKH